MAFYNGFPEYISVAERKRRAAAAAEKLKKKDGKVWPIEISGRTIATTWWGKAWCDNLESYADLGNRIARGRSYVRHGAVLDLQIAQGKAAALVQGSSSKPYKVEVTVAPLSGDVWQSILKECAGKVNSLQELAAGKFPKGLSELFTTKGKGLFPAPKEIKFSCSCPDYAVMCKHVAAVLYGIGARFDDNSALFFELRQTKVDELITASLAEQTKALMGSGGRRSRRAMDVGDLADTFGIELDAGGSESADGRQTAGAVVAGEAEAGRHKAEGDPEHSADKPRQGRPPKNKAEAEPEQSADKPRRGRPPKNRAESDPEQSADKPHRGRPPKNMAESDPEQSADKPHRGRPPKNKAESDPEQSADKPRRGRPPKNRAESDPEQSADRPRRGKPPKNRAESDPEHSADKPRRGRPSKNKAEGEQEKDGGKALPTRNRRL